jgi:hypothetical protein
METVAAFIPEQTCVIRRTGGRVGRRLAAAPGMTPLRYLQCGRIAGRLLAPVETPSGPVQ